MTMEGGLDLFSPFPSPAYSVTIRFSEGKVWRLLRCTWTLFVLTYGRFLNSVYDWGGPLDFLAVVVLYVRPTVRSEDCCCM